jgi:uncharacterized membrane protein YqjE
MSVPESADSGQGSSLFSSLRSFWAVLISILSTRLDLASVELEETGTHALRTLMMGLAALLCLFMTIFFILFFLVVMFWPEAPLVLGIICIVCMLGSVSLFLATRQLLLTWPKFLAQTVAELKRDVEGLRSTVVIKKDES